MTRSNNRHPYTSLALPFEPIPIKNRISQVYLFPYYLSDHYSEVPIFSFFHKSINKSQYSYMNIEHIPPITKFYLAGIILTTIGCQLQLFNKYQLFFNWALFYNERQYWRIITTFFYFGRLSLDTVFHLYFLFQYCQTLEEDSFRGKKSDFIWFLGLSCTSLIVLSVVCGLSKEIPFLSSSLTFTLTYLWSRRNPSLRMTFLGLFTFNAPYLPWTLIAFSVILQSVVPWADMLGFVVGHAYYYAEDVYPRLESSNGYRLLKTPEWLVRILEGGRGEVEVEEIPDIQMNVVGRTDTENQNPQEIVAEQQPTQ